jgi:biopolymer transport protein ExbD
MAFGRLRKKRGETSIPTDSLSDIAFLLIIFFILTTSIRRTTGFTADLPSAQKTPPQTQQTEKTPTIALKDDTLRLDGNVVSLADLRTKLLAMNLAAKPENDRIIILETAGKVPYQQYYEVMALVTGTGGIVGLVAEDDAKAGAK